MTVAVWDGPPFAGQTWRKRVDGSQETRHVVDRTLGSDVIYIPGRWSRHAYQSRCTLEEWNIWAQGAKLRR